MKPIPAPLPAGAPPSGRPAHARRRVPIPTKVSLLLLVTILGVVLPVSFLILDKQQEQAFARVLDFGRSLTTAYANYSSEFLLQEDWPSLDPLIREAARMREVTYVAVVDRSGVIRGHSEVSRIEQPWAPPSGGVPFSREGALTVSRRGEGDASVLDFSLPATYGGAVVGSVHIGLSPAPVADDARELRLYIILLTAVAVAVGLAVSLAAGRLFTRPLAALTGGIREIAGGNLDHRIEPASNDELGDLARAFNDMAGELRSKELIQASFGRYVTPELAGLILRDPSRPWLRGTRKLVTVLFADLRNFTAFSEDRQPEEITLVLNGFFSLATEAVLAEGGFVNKFSGDQVMAVFGAPVHLDDHALRAVRAAVRLQEALRRWNAGREERGQPALWAGTGVNTGLVVAGTIGSEQRMEYSVIGDDVNLASRLTDLAGPDEIIVSEKTAEHVRAFVTLRPLEPVRVKGKRLPVMTFLLLEVRGGAG